MSARIVIVNNESFLVRFSNFSEDFRQINCGVPLRIDTSTMLKWDSRQKTIVPKKAGNHLLRNDFSANRFRWILFEFEDPHGELLHRFGLICIYLKFVTCDDLINVF